MALRWFRFGKKQEEEGCGPRGRARRRGTRHRLRHRHPSPRRRRTRPRARGRGAGAEVAAGAAGRRPGAHRRTADESRDAPRARSGSAGAPSATPERKAERKPDKRQPRSSSRARTPTKRAPLPAAKRELLISVDVGEQRVAILEDDRVAEVYLERPERRSIAGNIYLGVVDNVLPGMEAAFVEIGLEKNGFLYVDEIVGPELEGRKGARKIQDLIKRGQTILVQAVKDPMKSKGARLTTEISLPGRFLVYVPNGEGSGVSRRLEDAERTRLKEIVKKLDPKGGGIIVRTAAEGASAEDIERDLVFLQRLWKTIQTKAKGASAPTLVYEEAELPLRIVRDLFAGDFVGRADRRRPHPPAHRQLPEEDLAAHDRARPSLSREARRSSRRRASTRRSARRSSAASISPPAATSSSTMRRRSPSSTSTPAASSARAGRARRGGSRTRS